MLSDTATLPRAVAAPTTHVRDLTGSQQVADLLQLLLEVFDHTIKVGLHAPDVHPNADQVSFFLLHRLGHERVEVMYAMFFSATGSLLHERELTRGSYSACLPSPREIARTALSLGAAGVVLAHNHPSGSPQPSSADIRFSAAVSNALALVDATLVDHLIVAGGITVSMRKLDCLQEFPLQ